jgi:hypothetical protein
LIDTANLDVRPVQTPDGPAMLDSFDDKDDPKEALVHFASAGKGPGENRNYPIKKLEEVE